MLSVNDIEEVGKIMKEAKEIGYEVEVEGDTLVFTKKNDSTIDEHSKALELHERIKVLNSKVMTPRQYITQTLEGLVGTGVSDVNSDPYHHVGKKGLKNKGLKY
mgnify:CR=1 FL=1